MKNQKDFVLFSILSAFIILLSSCGGGAGGGGIFSAIEGEVKLGKKTAGWAITSMAYYNGNLYCSNGDKIFTKGYNGGRGWASQSTSFDGAIGLLASDDNYVYVLSYKPSTEVDPSDQKSYNYSDTQLSILNGDTGIVNSISNIRTIFDNKAIGGREAFATTADGTVYKLNGKSAPTPLSGQADKASAVKVGGSTQFIQSFISTSDYSNSRAWYIPLSGNGSSNITEGNTPQFTIVGINGAPSIDLSRTAGDGPLSEKKHGKISGLAYYEEENSSGITQQYLLVATTKGYYRVTLDGTNVVKANPHKNGEQLSGMGIIEGAFWTLPTGAIYAGVTTADKNRYGLWAYYPNDAWNVD